jgi:hypothetical protein
MSRAPGKEDMDELGDPAFPWYLNSNDRKMKASQRT